MDAPETTLPTHIETLVTTARESGLSDEMMVDVLRDAVEALREGVS
jgi:hypothetical protein